MKQCHCMALFHILFGLCTSVYLITSGCCSTCTDTPSLERKNLAIPVTAHNSNTPKESELPVTAPGSWARAFPREKLNFCNFTASFKMKLLIKTSFNQRHSLAILKLLLLSNIPVSTDYNEGRLFSADTVSQTVVSQSHYLQMERNPIFIADHKKALKLNF